MKTGAKIAVVGGSLAVVAGAYFGYQKIKAKKEQSELDKFHAGSTTGGTTTPVITAGNRVPSYTPSTLTALDNNYAFGKGEAMQYGGSRRH